MTPYYADDQVTLYHGDCRDILPRLAPVDLVITDPPYSERTHAGARSNRVPAGFLDFDSIKLETLHSIMATLGKLTAGWIVTSLDYRHALQFEQEPPEGLRMLRLGVWVKLNPVPQISGDRPGMGWEAIGFMHRADVKPAWNGGGRVGVWSYRPERSGHPTGKPLPMVADWVRLFSDPGDLILDPFAGSGTTLRAAKDEGRRAVGIEIDERYCELAAKRLTQGVLDFGEPA